MLNVWLDHCRTPGAARVSRELPELAADTTEPPVLWVDNLRVWSTSACKDWTSPCTMSKFIWAEWQHHAVWR